MLSKAVPLVAGTIYLVGYFVIARYLADYGVPVTQLVSAQYLIAGMPPGVLLWFTLAVGYSAYRYAPKAYRYAPKGEGRAQVYVGFLIIGLVLVLVAIAVVNAILNKWNIRILGTGTWFDLYVVTLFRVLLGQAALWYFIAGLRTGLFARMRTYFGALDAFVFPIYTLAMAVAMIYGSHGAMAQVYTAIPQAYGGGKPLIVQLYVEREKAPLELLASNTAGEKTPMVYTVPVEMVSRASDALIVSTVTNGARRVWALDAHIVRAVLSSPKPPRGLDSRETK